MLNHGSFVRTDLRGSLIVRTIPTSQIHGIGDGWRSPPIRFLRAGHGMGLLFDQLREVLVECVECVASEPLVEVVEEELREPTRPTEPAPSGPTQPEPAAMVARRTRRRSASPGWRGRGKSQSAGRRTPATDGQVPASGGRPANDEPPDLHERLSARKLAELPGEALGELRARPWNHCDRPWPGFGCYL